MAGGSSIRLLMFGVVLWCVCTWSVALSCDWCGQECQSVCGTRNFRTCCFNYLRKRSDVGWEQRDGPGLRLELLMVPELVARYWDPPEQEAGNPIDQEAVPSSGERMQLVYNA